MGGLSIREVRQASKSKQGGNKPVSRLEAWKFCLEKSNIEACAEEASKQAPFTQKRKQKENLRLCLSVLFRDYADSCLVSQRWRLDHLKLRSSQGRLENRSKWPRRLGISNKDNEENQFLDSELETVYLPTSPEFRFWLRVDCRDVEQLASHIIESWDRTGAGAA